MDLLAAAERPAARHGGRMIRAILASLLAALALANSPWRGGWAAFWETKVLPRLGPDGRLVLLVARVDDRIVGTVQLDHDTPPNQPHRADIAKMMVAKRTRGRGIGAALLTAVEALAVAQRKLQLLDSAATLDAHQRLEDLARDVEEGRVGQLEHARRQRRVGGHQPLKSNVRVIAATNQNIGASARNGGFREDLFDRLNVISVTIPPLRERQQDKLQPHETHLFATEPEKRAPNKVAWCFAHGPPRIFQ